MWNKRLVLQGNVFDITPKGNVIWLKNNILLNAP